MAMIMSEVIGAGVILHDDVAQDLPGHLGGDAFTGERRERGDPGQGTLELANVVRHVFGNEEQHVRGDGGRGEIGVLAKNGKPGLDIGSLDVREQAPFETTAEPILEGGKVLRMTIRADDELPDPLRTGC